MDRVSEKDRSDRDRDHKHRHRHRERHHEEKRYEDDFEEDDRVVSSRRSKDEKHRNGDHRLHSSGKRKEHGEADDSVLDRRSEKRLRVSDGSKEERRERRRRRFEDRIAEDPSDLNGFYREERTEDRKFKDRGNEGEEEEEEDMGDHLREGRSHKNRKKEEPLNDGQERKREKRKFGDRVKEEKTSDVEEAGTVVIKEERKVEPRYKDGLKEEEVGYAEEGTARNLKKKPEVDGLDGDRSNVAYEKSGSADNLAALEPLIEESRAISKNSSASSNSHPTKVSSITATNENEGVNVTRSDEIPGKFSTDGATTSVAGKGGSGNLSLDALAKAKKALQMQKQLSERLKKIPILNKGMTSSSVGQESGPLSSRTPVSASFAQTTSGLQSLPAVAPAALKPPAAGSTAPQGAGLTTIPNIEAVKRAQELAAKMGFHQDPEFAPLINMFPAPVPADVTVPQRPSKAPVLRLDAQGREVDEHGNVINMPKLTNLSTLKVNINKQKKEAFQILRPELDAGIEANPHFDSQMGINKAKLLRPKRMTFQFVEEGKWSRQAEIIRFKSQFGDAQAKELKTKQAQLAKAKAEPDINPNLIEVSERVVKKEKPKDPIPEVEWWDLPILPSGIYVDASKDKLNMEKITIYIEHPRPIEPPAEPAPPDPQPLKLTKGEQKKLRTQRRLAKERDRQEMIRQGLIEPPKPKVKMSNLMKVLGTEATQDPTRLEMEIRSAAIEREQAHVDRNIARKLTPAERREKKERKLFDDPNTLETIVSVYKVNHLAHPKARFQVDVNAQENRMTGCAVLSEGISVVVVEGGKKSNKRYKNLMLKRIDWAAAAVGNEEEGADDPEVATPVNKCLLVWQGSVAKRGFNRFLIHECRTEAAARKVFADAGVAHYWDLAVNFSGEV